MVQECLLFHVGEKGIFRMLGKRVFFFFFCMLGGGHHFLIAREEGLFCMLERRLSFLLHLREEEVIIF